MPCHLYDQPIDPKALCIIDNGYIWTIRIIGYNSVKNDTFSEVKQLKEMLPICSNACYPLKIQIAERVALSDC
jgi:hypothetical protein